MVGMHEGRDDNLLCDPMVDLSHDYVGGREKTTRKSENNTLGSKKKGECYGR